MAKAKSTTRKKSAKKLKAKGKNKRKLSKKSQGLSRSEKRGRTGASEKPNPLLAYGRTALKRSAGRVREEFHPDLREPSERAKAYEEMGLNSGLIGGAMMMYQTFTQQSEWNWRMHEAEDDIAKRQAEFFQQAEDEIQTPWSTRLGEFWDAAEKGFSIHEVLFKKRHGPNARDESLRSAYNDGLYGWLDWEARAARSIDRWDFDDRDRAIGFWQHLEWIPYTKTKRDPAPYVPLAKCIHLKLRERNRSPEGISWYRNAYRSYELLTEEEDAEAIGFRRLLAGFPILRMPWQMMVEGAEEQFQAIHDLADTILEGIDTGTLAGVAWPSQKDMEGKDVGFDVDTYPVGSMSSLPTEPAIQRHRSTMLIAFLAETLLLSQGDSPTGSHALASEKTSVIAMVANSVMRRIQLAVHGARDQLARMNGFNMDRLPTWNFSDIESPDLAAWATALSALMTSGGLTADSGIERFLRDTFGLPELAPTTIRRPAPAGGAAGSLPPG